MAFPQVYSVSGILIEVQILVSVFMHSVIGSLNGVLDIIQELIKDTALTTAIIMGVVAFLSKADIGGITKAIYTTVIRDVGVFTDVNLHRDK